MGLFLFLVIIHKFCFVIRVNRIKMSDFFVVVHSDKES